MNTFIVISLGYLLTAAQLNLSSQTAVVTSGALPIERFADLFGFNELISSAEAETKEARFRKDKIPAYDPEPIVQLKSLLLDGIQKFFTMEEVTKALAFLESPEGKKVMFSGDKVSDELKKITREWMTVLKDTAKQNKLFLNYPGTLPKEIRE